MRKYKSQCRGNTQWQGIRYLWIYSINLRKTNTARFLIVYGILDYIPSEKMQLASEYTSHSVVLTIHVNPFSAKPKMEHHWSWPRWKKNKNTSSRFQLGNSSYTRTRIYCDDYNKVYQGNSLFTMNVEICQR